MVVVVQEVELIDLVLVQELVEMVVEELEVVI